MNYDIKLPEAINDNKLFGALKDYNNLNAEDFKQLFQSELYLKTSQAKCVMHAIERIKKAKINQEKVFVGGDYDADGICATAIMKDALDKYGIKCGYYIPNRFKEGYGLNADIVSLAYEKGYTLIITVDNGVKAYEALKKAESLNMDVIITDHHLIEKEMDYICVHPDYMETDFKAMCGAGVALQIARNLIGEDDFHTCLAGIATIGDVMPLLNENRNIVKHALKILNQHKYPVFDLLLNKKTIDETDISFLIVPKLNALGRLSDIINPNEIIRNYFLQKDNNIIIKMSSIINNVNEKRKSMSKSMSDLALKLMNDDDFVIIQSEEFHEGIVGLIAGKLASVLNKPVIIFNKDNNILKGSGRSIAGFDLHEFLKNTFSDFLTFGGHSQAVGLSIKEEDFNIFYEKFYNNYKTVSLLNPKIRVYKLAIADLAVNNVKALNYLSPFGQSVRLPMVLIDDFKKSSYQLLKQMYPKYIFNQTLEAVGFDDNLSKNIIKPQFIVGDFKINNFNGQEKISINIKDIV